MLQHSPPAADSIVVRTPLPRGAGPVVRAILNAPTRVQAAAIAALIVVAAVVLLVAWHYREAWWRWLTTRSRGWKIALAAAMLLVVTGGSAFGVAAWNYTQHNNDFCIGCHVMTPAWQRFQHSEHRKLLCHDCHQQSLLASMRQLYLWVAERPNEIPAHAKVPTRICENCHNQAHPDSTWKRILATAGHSVHLRNDTLPLRNVQCVTCHGAEVHHFVPVDKTCGQGGCHDALKIQLGKMAGQSTLHCTGCHSFTRVVARGVSPDSVRTALVPTGEKCLECHDMRKRLSTELVSLGAGKEPHKAVCGACHNPHKQSTPKAAFASCATAQCHARADTLTPFHRGLPPGALGQCGSCHKAHVWKVASTDCVACHRNMGRQPRGAVAAHDAQEQQQESQQENRQENDQEPEPGFGPFVAPEPQGPPQAAPAQPVPARDTGFTHARHSALSCTTCHSAEREHGVLKFSRPAGCHECHHSKTQKVSCTGCHPTRSLPAAALSFSAAMSVRTVPTPMSLPFDHPRHQAISCRTCHTDTAGTSVLAARPTCDGCHPQHHAPERQCATCHALPTTTVVAAHPRETVHDGCAGANGCHRDDTIRELPPARNVCVACHRNQAQHQPGRECAGCHLVQWAAGPPPANRGAP